MDVAIVKYNAGNIYSVVNAMKRLGINPILTDDAEMLQKADRVLFPGQGQAKEAMEYLKAHQLDQVIKNLTQPVLGICVGQQLLCRHSEEGDVDCIGIFDVNVKRFKPQKHEDKVPAMGWNELYDLKTDLYKGLSHPYSYFVHSYYVPLRGDNRYSRLYPPLQCIFTQRQFLYLPIPPRKKRKGRGTNLEKFLGLITQPTEN